MLARQATLKTQLANVAGAPVGLPYTDRIRREAGRELLDVDGQVVASNERLAQRRRDLVRATEEQGRINGSVAASADKLAAAEGRVAASAGLAASLGSAFLLMLERLTPRERAAYLLHEIFDRPYGEIAATLEMEEPACRKLVSRAKANIDQAKVRHRTPAETQERLLDAFRIALSSGSPDGLAALLSSDIRLTADGGGKVRSALKMLTGHRRVLAFLRKASQWWAGYAWAEAEINGGRGIFLTEEGRPAAAISFAYDEEGRLSDIFIMRNPDKLGRLEPVAIQ